MHSLVTLPAIVATLATMPFQGKCYRIVDFAALTGSMIPLFTLGPGRNGQRYTPKGGPNALYVGEDLVTAEAEYFGVKSNRPESFEFHSRISLSRGRGRNTD